jgi:hypothetical protein
LRDIQITVITEYHLPHIKYRRAKKIHKLILVKGFINIGKS